MAQDSLKWKLIPVERVPERIFIPRGPRFYRLKEVKGKR